METFSVLTSFNLAETIWKRYERYAVPKIEGGTLVLKGVLFEIEKTDMSASSAKKELETLSEITSLFYPLAKVLQKEDAPEIKKFKDVSLEFIHTLHEIEEAFMEKAYPNSNYLASHPVLSEDWDSKEDDHWDKY